MGGFPSSNIGVTGPLDALNSALSGYFDGRQAAQSLRDQRLKEARQSLLDQSTLKHQQSQEGYWDGLITDRNQRTSNLAIDRLNKDLDSLDLQVGKGFLTPDQYYRSKAAVLARAGEDPTTYGIPDQYLPNYQPKVSADGTPQAPAPIDPNALIGPTTTANNDKTGAFAHLADTRSKVADLKSVEGLLAAVGNKPAANQADFLQGLYGGDPNAPQIPIPGVTPISSRQVPVAGPSPQGDVTQGIYGLPNATQPILQGPYSPDVKTAADIDRMNQAAALSKARIPLVTNQAQLTADLSTLIPGRKALLGAQADNAKASANLHNVMAQWLPKMDASLIDERTGNLDLRQWQATHGRPINMSDVLRMEESMSKPGAASMTFDASGNPSMTPGISGKDANPALWGQLEALKTNIGNQPTYTPPNGLGRPGSSTSGVRLQSPDAGNLPMGVTKSGNKYQIVGP